MIQNHKNVALASARIKDFIHNTPVLYSGTLNSMLSGSRVFFKVDALQKTGAFKIRGVINKILSLTHSGTKFNKIIAYSTGNHGLAVACGAKLFGFESQIYLPNNVASIKRDIASYYGAQVIITETRQEAEERAQNAGNIEGNIFFSPSDDDDIISGSGTMCFEAINSLKLGEVTKKPVKLDAIFASCGGGGLLSGSLLARNLLSPDTKLIGVEPELANDAYLSLQSGVIYRFNESPKTFADGLRALSISKRTFEYLKQLDDFMTISEDKIAYWTVWLNQLIKITCEPSSAISMAAAHEWIKKQEEPKDVLVLISGGNVDRNFYKSLFSDEYLKNHPFVH